MNEQYQQQYAQPPMQPQAPQQYAQPPMQPQAPQQYAQPPMPPQLKVIKPGKNAVYIGYVVSDPEIRTTQNGNEVCGVRLGLETGMVGADGKAQNEFIEITCWGSAAVYYSKLCKGDWIEVKGTAHNEPFTNNQGVTIDKWKLNGIIAPLPSHLALRIEKAFTRNTTAQVQQAQAPQQYAQPQPQPQPPMQTQAMPQSNLQGFVDIADEAGDLPF